MTDKHGKNASCLDTVLQCYNDTHQVATKIIAAVAHHVAATIIAATNIYSAPLPNQNPSIGSDSREAVKRMLDV